ncbi:hypothetical protein A3J90_05310 [candidate division WOR-1 bacterium RIFOXYC2_FULL_37_10]|nr:MAG: hypothetical protein A2246_03335 [candidate division WOR-1 bacterium RIFOXYA2_FULL_37_7]OGC35161.1 MAG: hypothetical protein A3J90_05310 [candidate division WOR-1 bacterium RIFOXYC2_FULL_37_10]
MKKQAYMVLIIIATVIVFASLANAISISNPTETIDLNINGCYTGAVVSWKTVDDNNPWETTSADLEKFEEITGKHLTIVASYRAFSYDGNPYYFPFNTYKTVKKNNSMLFLSWEPRDWDQANPLYYKQSLLPDIIAGKYDEYLDKWAKDIKSLNTPIFLRFAHEMNIENLSWSGAKNGGGKKGAETYIAAYRHVHDCFATSGVKNVIWVWTPIKWGIPFEPWNHYTNYYPGNDYVDVIAMDEYNWGASQPWSHWQSFNDIYWQLYSELINLYPSKPLIIGEFSSSEKGGDKSKWIKEAFRDIKEKYPKIKAFIWFHVDNQGERINNVLENTDWRINSSPESIFAAKEALSDTYYIDKIKFRKK